MIEILLSQLIFKGEEKFLANVKQLTFVGENAEAYFSPKGDLIVFQSKGKGGLYLKVKKKYVPTLQKRFKERGYDFVIRNLERNTFMLFVEGLTDRKIADEILAGMEYEHIFVKPDLECDQIFLMDTNGLVLRMVSTGKGRTTCSWFISEHEVVFSSTHEHYDGRCPENPYVHEYRKRGKYVWPLFNYDIYVRNLKTNTLTKIYGSDGYDAEIEGTFGKRIVFTSTMDNEIELYEITYGVDKPVPRRITNFPGYDGGAMFSPSGRYIVFRANHLKTQSEFREFHELLSKGLVNPEHVELFIYDTRKDTFWQITHTPPNVANFAPYFLPDEKHVVFSSNMHAPGSFSFELYVVDIHGRNLQRITYSNGFNSFPMISRDGRKIVWTSDRNAKGRREFNIFVADWLYGKDRRTYTPSERRR